VYTISEFSKITQITPKALRYYHEIGLLIPAKIDDFNNYRGYSVDQIDKALLILDLKELGFSLDETKEVIAGINNDKDIVKRLKDQKNKINEEIDKYKFKFDKLDQILKEKEKNKMNNINCEIQEKQIPEILIASIKHQGAYKEIGPLFGKLFRACGFKNICGTAFALYYDECVKENDASYEACIPIKNKIDKEGIAVKVLKGGHAFTLIHKGPYDSLGSTYKKILDYMKEKNIKPISPSREVYLKGPGLIFNNPKKYVTEIQFLVK